MREPRLYLYRKAGRAVWDAEMWLPDGRRTTWRTGCAEWDHAERAARDRLATLVAGSESGAMAPPAEISSPPTPAVLADRPGDLGDQPAGSSSPTTEMKAPDTWFQRLDNWFFSDLKDLLSET
jgi:hypothetical protein